MSGKGQSPRGPQVKMEPEIGGENKEINDENKEQKIITTNSRDEMKKMVI